MALTFKTALSNSKRDIQTSQWDELLLAKKDYKTAYKTVIRVDYTVNCLKTDIHFLGLVLFTSH